MNVSIWSIFYNISVASVLIGSTAFVHAASSVQPGLTPSPVRRFMTHVACLDLTYPVRSAFRSYECTCFHQGMRFHSARAKKLNTTYLSPVYNSAFGKVLSDDSIRASFLRAFVPKLDVIKSEPINKHIASFARVKVLQYVKSLQLSFPQTRFNETMDFICHLQDGKCVLISTRATPTIDLNPAALMCTPSFYLSQLNCGQTMEVIDKFISLTIVGGKNHLPTTSKTNQYLMHYKFEEQCHKVKERVPYVLDSIELMHYFPDYAPQKINDSELRDWFTFFRKAHCMIDEEVESNIATKAVRDAFEKIKLCTLPSEFRDYYREEVARYSHAPALEEFDIEKSNKNFVLERSNLINASHLSLCEKVLEQRLERSRLKHNLLVENALIESFNYSHARVTIPSDFIIKFDDNKYSLIVNHTGRMKRKFGNFHYVSFEIFDQKNPMMFWIEGKMEFRRITTDAFSEKTKLEKNNLDIDKELFTDNDATYNYFQETSEPKEQPTPWYKGFSKSDEQDDRECHFSFNVLSSVGFSQKELEEIMSDGEQVCLVANENVSFLRKNLQRNTLANLLLKNVRFAPFLEISK